MDLHHQQIKRRLRDTVSATILMTVISAPLAVLTTNSFADNLPANGSFAAGSGKIVSSAGGLTINQTSSSGVIDWRSFAISQGKTVQINNGGGVTLIRVAGGISQIAGALNATGTVYLVNPAGLIVTPTGKVLTQGGFIASTRDIGSQPFPFSAPAFFSGASQGNIMNNGSVVSASGDAALIGSNVSNAGSLSAAQGKASLSAGNRVVLSSRGSGHITVQEGNGSIVNIGRVTGAQVDLGAASGSVSNESRTGGGVIRARGTSRVPAKVWITTAGATDIKGNVSAQNADGSGGTIVAAGNSVSIGNSSSINASGTTGGTILIGGDVHGGAIVADNFIPQKVQTASATSVSKSAKLNANGLRGRGGHVVVWSNGRTNFAGRIDAQGSVRSPGGFAEVSSHGVLNFTGHANLLSPGGATGTLLLDPYNVIISGGTTTNMSCSGGVCSATGNNSILNVSTLESLLSGANTEVSTGSSGSQAGNITVFSSISWSAATTLTLDAYHSIFVEASISVEGAGAGLTLTTNDGGSGGVYSFSYVPGGAVGNVYFASTADYLGSIGLTYQKGRIMENPDRPTEEIEVTPVMIEAAETVFETAYFGDGVYGLTEEVITRAFRAMVEARQISRSQELRSG